MWADIIFSYFNIIFKSSKTWIYKEILKKWFFAMEKSRKLIKSLKIMEIFTMNTNVSCYVKLI